MKLFRLFAASLALGASLAAAQQTQPSDTLRITLPAGGVFVVTLTESAAGATGPETAVFNLPPLPDGVLTTLLPPTIAPVKAAVVLLEPVGATPDPGTTPIFFNNRIVSDFVIAFFTPNSLVSPVGVALISDGDGNLALWASILFSGAVPVIGLDETGAFQDLTVALGTPYRVEVVSDVGAVPEPGSAALLLLGAGVVLCASRRLSVQGRKANGA